MNELTLLVDGVAYAGWQSVDIRRGVDRIAGSFWLEVSELWPGQADPREIPPGAACELRLAREVLIRGWIDTLWVQYDAGQHTTRVSGRDATGDLVDCTAISGSGQCAGQTLTQIAASLCAPFGVQVRADTDVGPAFALWAIQPGETVADCLQRAARQRGVLLTSDASGNLVITRAGRVTLPTVLELGRNILSASGQRSHVDRYSTYELLGQQPDGDDISGSAATEVYASTTDAQISRYRPLRILAEDAVDLATARSRIEWEASRRLGQSVAISYAVQGWDSGDGVWQPNRIINVRDPFLRVDGPLYICDVQLQLDDGGSRSILSLTRVEAYDLVPLPDPDSETELQ